MPRYGSWQKRVSLRSFNATITLTYQLTVPVLAVVVTAAAAVMWASLGQLYGGTRLDTYT